MSESIEFVFLADREDAVPTVANWYFEQWGRFIRDGTLRSLHRRVRSSLNRDEIPFILLAVRRGEAVGAAELKLKEMADIFPEKEHWLGGVYVGARHRGKGYGSMLAEEIARRAPRYGVETLHLQTEALDGGLYARLGWSPVARVDNHGLEVLVMERRLSVPEAS